MCSFICCLKELVQDGIRFPVVGFDSPSTVTKVLLQQPGKLKAKQLREGEKLPLVIHHESQSRWFRT